MKSKNEVIKPDVEKTTASNTSTDESFLDKYVIVRSETAGVFAGTLKEEDGDTVILHNARWIWYWEGAASLHQLAMEGTKKPKECKFPMEVKRLKVLKVIQIIEVTDEARRNIAAVPIWKA